MADYKETGISQVQIEETNYPISYIETQYNDETHGVRRYRGDYALRKVYTGVLGVANGSAPNNNTYANTSFYFLNVKPDSWYVEWTVKYHLNIHLDDENQVYKNSSGTTYYPGQTMRGLYDCMISGTQGAYSTFHFFQSQKNTSYRPIYYHMTHSPTSAGHTAGLPFKIGISLASSYLPTPTANYQSGSAVTTKYSRTIEVVVDEAINCEVSLNEVLEIEADAYATGDMLNYTKLNSTYYTTNTSASNSAGRWNNLSATTQGLYESGDDNTYTYTQQSSNYLVNGTTYSDNSAGYLLGYSMIGFDKDGKALMISKKSPTTTAYNTGIDQTRVYCNAGFDYTKGIRYVSTSTNFAANANMNVSTQMNYSGLDFRYNDNCVAGSSANTLGLVNREPVYLRGTIGSDGLFYLDPIEVTYSSKTYKRVWVQPGDTTRLNTSPFDTEHIYWFVGYPYYNSTYPNSLYQLNLITQGELNAWDGTKLVPYLKGNIVEDTFIAVAGTDFTDSSSIHELTNLSSDFKDALKEHKDIILQGFLAGGQLTNTEIKIHYKDKAIIEGTTVLLYEGYTSLFTEEILRFQVLINSSNEVTNVEYTYITIPAGLIWGSGGTDTSYFTLYDGDAGSIGQGIYCSAVVNNGLPSREDIPANSVLATDEYGNLMWKAPYNGEHSNG